jgi:hypothetical protein
MIDDVEPSPTINQDMM